MIKTIILTGMAGSGKSTVGKLIAKKYNFEFFCGGDALKQFAKEQGYKITGDDWWETPEGMKFLNQRMKDKSFDKKIDEILIERAKQGKVVITSWALPWLFKDGFKIWLSASYEARAKRIVERDGIKYEEALKAVKERDQTNIKLYKKLYNYNLASDLTPFDLIINTDLFLADKVFEIADKAISLLKW